MTRRFNFAAGTILTVVVAAACGRSGDAPAPAAVASGAHSPAAITLRTNPDPPTTGKTRFEVTVKAPNGTAVTDAEFIVSYFMVDMPSMRHELRLEPAGAGTYAGSGDIEMAGKWEVKASAKRDGQEIGTHTTTVAAK